MATQADLDRAFAWAQAQVGKTYKLGEFDCSIYMSGIATMIRDGRASRWFTTHPFHSGAFSPVSGWERDLEAPFMIGITADGIGHTGGTLLGVEFESTPPKARSGPAARGARDPMFKYVYGFRPSLLEAPTVAITAADIRAKASGGTQVSNGRYEEGSTSSVAVMERDGAIHWTSGMSIDCDGQPGSVCNINTDPYFQPSTSWTQSDGKALKAESLPFIVVPLPSNVWNYAASGIVGGNLCTIVYKDKYIHAVVGDQGPSQRIGEASYAAAAALGVPPSPTSGGVGSGVTYIVYPGVKVSPIESAAEAHRLGEQELAEWLGVINNPTPETYTVKAGDTFSGISNTFDVDVDNLAKFNSLIRVGQNLKVAADENPGGPTVETVVAAVGDTWSTLAAKAGISVDELLGLNNLKVAPGATYIVKKTQPQPPTDPYANGLPMVNMDNPSAQVLQTELKRVGYLAASVELADNYGPLTQAAVVAFHNDNPQFRTGVYDPSIDTMGWTFLRGMANGSGKLPTTPVENTSGRIAVNDVLYTPTSTMTGKAFAEETVRTTLALMGLPVTNEWVNGYLTMALRESSYNPNAVNTYDSNAKNVVEINGGKNVSDGHPGQCSRGMWQCIPQTFARYHQAGTSLSIYDAVASCAASINYVRAAYGVANDGSNLAAKVQQADPNRPSKGY